jgi:hypothetical protein
MNLINEKFGFIFIYIYIYIYMYKLVVFVFIILLNKFLNSFKIDFEKKL